MQVKRNCNKLFDGIQIFCSLCRPISVCETFETGRGREEHRRVELFANHAELPKGWNGVERIVRVRRWGTRDSKPYEHLHYYVLSKPLDSAQEVAMRVRGHWGIENNLHWVKDAILGEDQMTIRRANAATVVAHLNTIALNLLRLAGHKPNKDTFAKFANKVNELYFLFGL